MTKLRFDIKNGREQQKAHAARLEGGRCIVCGRKCWYLSDVCSDRCADEFSEIAYDWAAEHGY